MAKRDIFSQKTFISEPIDELIIKKKATIVYKGIPMLTAHGKSKNLSNKVFGIGRDTRNGVIISDTSVSKFHATVRFKKGKAFIQDIDSRNGTYINGKKLIPNKFYDLNNDDVIVFGKTQTSMSTSIVLFPTSPR